MNKQSQQKKLGFKQLASSAKFKIVMAILIASFTMLLSTTSHACRFSSDCSMGSKCVKHGLSQQGICTGGKRPGNANDRSLQGILKGNTSDYGKTCMFNSDCGFRLKCNRPGVEPGVCLKN